jgi:RHS repeat-associated protein
MQRLVIAFFVALLSAPLTAPLPRAAEAHETRGADSSLIIPAQIDSPTRVTTASPKDPKDPDGKRRPSPRKAPKEDPQPKVKKAKAPELITARSGDPWGDNWSGQLGDSTTTDRSFPRRAPGIADVTAVALGLYHTIVLRADGTVWAAGDNHAGQLGDGTVIDSATFVRVGALSGVTAISAGAYHSLARKSDGTLWAWGYNFSGQLGTTSTDTCIASPCSRSPLQVPIAGVSKIAAAGFHSLAIKTDGTLWAWGYDGDGQLGDGTAGGSRTTPGLVLAIGPTTSISGGAYHTLAIRTDGTVWSWGWNAAGQLGTGDTASRATPAPVPGLTDATAVAAGAWHSLVLHADTTVWAFGNNDGGALGSGDWADHLSPVHVVGWFEGLLYGVEEIGASWEHSIARDWNDDVWGWGWNWPGSVGDGTRSHRNAPVRVRGVNNVGLLDASIAAAGGFRSAAVTSEGAFLGWGDDFNGELGLSTTTDRSIPRNVVGLTNPISVAGGEDHSVAVRGDGSVVAWGSNALGQLGDGTTTNRASPVAVSALSNVSMVAAGSVHSLALKTDGTVWAWGEGIWGQLGNGAGTNSLTPVQVSGLTSVTKIAAGRAHNFAIKSDGTVWAWGYNGDGQIGDGTNTQRNAPVQISSLTGAIAVAGGHYHSVAVKADGTVWAWGYNGDGQLGDGTTTSRSAPVRSGTLTSVSAIAGGGYHTLAAKSDGTVWAWGANGYGQLGDGTAVSRSSPVQMLGVAAVTHVAGGWMHSHVRKSDGTVWGTGWNFFGGVGDGTNSNRSSLVQVLALTNAASVSDGYRHALVTPMAAAPAVLLVESTPTGTERGRPLINGAMVAISVISSSGALSLSFSDAVLAGRGPVPALTRTYNSNDTRVGPLGPGWTHNYLTRLVDPGGGSGDIVLVGSLGRRDRFTNSGGMFTPPPGVRTTLVSNADGTYTVTSKERTTSDFDGAGRLVRITDRHGNVSQMTYDPSGRLQSVSDPAGRGQLVFGYDASGRLTSATDWLNRGVQYAYDASGRLLRSTDREGGITTYTYDGSGRLASVREPNGNVALTVTYDGAGRVATEKDAAGLTTGRQTTLTYTATTTTATYPPSSFDGYAAVVTDTIDSNGWLTRREAKPTAAETSVGQFTYSASGQPLTFIDPRGYTTTYCWDRDYAGASLTPRSNLTRIIGPASPPHNPIVVLFKFDAFNNVIETVAARGVANGSSVTCTTSLASAINPLYVTTHTYDAAGRALIAQTQRFTDPTIGPQVATTKYEFGDAANPGHATRIIPPRGNTGPSPDYTYAVTLTYAGSGSEAGMLTRSTDALGNATTYAYDAVGRRTSMVEARGNEPGSDPNEYRTAWQYDAEDRVVRTTVPAPVPGGAPLVEQWRYDSAGNLAVSIDANGQVKKFLYDVRNLLRETQESPSPWTNPAAVPTPLYRTTYVYDDLGLLKRVTRAAADSASERATDTLYDGLGQLRRELQYPSWPATTGALTTNYSYDLAGNVASTTDPLGKTTTFGYDPRGHLLSASYVDGTPNVTYAYDRDGNRVSMVDGGGTTTYAIDELGRVTTMTAPGPKTVGYRYDLDGNRAKIIYPDATSVTYVFDKSNRLSSVSDWASRVTTYTYNADASLASTLAANGLQSAYTYDRVGRVTEIRQTQGGNTLAQHRYSMDAVGNRTRAEDVLAQLDGSAPSAWGENFSGQLGDGSTTTRDLPVAISGLGTVRAFGAGGYHSLALLPDGTVRAWGDNGNGQIGDGTNTSRLTPVAVTGLTDVTAVSAGEFFSIALMRDGTVRGWGYNGVGSVGDGTWIDRNAPVTVVNLASVTQISAGAEHALALRADGTVWSWGDNFEGQLGDGSTTRRGSPVQVKGVGGVGFLTGIVYIAAGLRHSLAVKSDGTVYAWGWNGWGQLGDGTLNDSSTPLIVKGPDGITPLSGVAMVSGSVGQGIGGGHGFSLALKTDGTVWGWGENVFGELGDGTTTRRPFPVRVGGSGFGSVIAIAAGGNHGLALKSDGSVWSWGNDWSGQLGRATSELCDGDPCATSPGQVPGLVKVFGIFTHYNHSLITSARFESVAYAYDQLYRMLSDGTTSYTYDPVGNRLSATAGGSTTSYTYDRADRVTAVGAVPHTMNAAGNLVARGSDSFTFDQANRLRTASVGGVSASYTYDGDGNRRSKTVGGSTTNYVFATSGQLALLLEDGTRKYIWGNGLAYGVDSGGTLTSMHGDALGSVRALTDGTGTLTQTYERDAFGVLQGTEGSSTQPFDFTGELRDAETGFLYLRARMYDPSIGRFISRDGFAGSSRHPQTQNRYSYVGNNPVTFTDPTGHCFFLCIAIAGVVGAVVGVASYTLDKTIKNEPITAEGLIGNALLGGAIGMTAAVSAFALAASGAGVLGSALAGALIGGGSEVLSQYGNGDDLDPVKIGTSMAVGAVGGSWAAAALPQGTKDWVASAAVSATEGMWDLATNMTQSAFDVASKPPAPKPTPAPPQNNVPVPGPISQYYPTSSTLAQAVRATGITAPVKLVTGEWIYP